MGFTWDPDKARRNLAKHGVSFELATRVWSDPLLDVSFDRIEDGEERWHALGHVGPVMLLVVVHSYLDEGERHVRLISARRASRHERRRYERKAF